MARKNELAEFLFPYAGRMLKFFPPFKCTDFVKCQGIINNPLHVTPFFTEDEDSRSDDEDSTFPSNVCKYVGNYMPPNPKRPQSLDAQALAASHK